MSASLWAYEPDICDGDYCPGDCDSCYKTEIIIDMMEEQILMDTMEMEGEDD